MADEILHDPASPTICVVDDDEDLLMSISRLLRRSGYQVQAFSAPEALLSALPSRPPECVLTDVMMGDMDGFRFAEILRPKYPATALIFMTAWPSVSDAVNSFRQYQGVNYLQKPLLAPDILSAVSDAIAWSRPRLKALQKIGQLTSREREVLRLLSQGHGNKQIAFHLDLSPKTIEYHRASLMTKMGPTEMTELFHISRLVEDLG